MAKQIRNNESLDALLMEAVYNAVDYTMKRILEENAELVDKYVYDVYNPGAYDRTFQFKDAWDYLSSKYPSQKKTVGEFYYDPTTMVYNPSDGQHGTPDDLGPEIQAQWGDAREYLADILYNKNPSMAFGGGEWTKKHMAWSELTKKMGQGKIFTWFEEGMAKQGLKLYKR